MHDLKRFDLFKASGFEEAKGEAALNRFEGQQLQLLNDRRTHNRIVKVLPVIGHDDKKFWLAQYPDAAAGHGVKQWTLLVGKRFRVGARVPAGSRYLGGGRVGLH